ncbi:MAG: hypothetical protein DMG27_09320, partial [Acidobacteria bacterium]
THYQHRLQTASYILDKMQALVRSVTLTLHERVLADHFEADEKKRTENARPGMQIHDNISYSGCQIGTGPENLWK